MKNKLYITFAKVLEIILRLFSINKSPELLLKLKILIQTQNNQDISK